MAGTQRVAAAVVLDGDLATITMFFQVGIVEKVCEIIGWQMYPCEMGEWEKKLVNLGL